MRVHTLLACGAVAMGGLAAPGVGVAESGHAPNGSRPIAATTITIDATTNLGTVHKELIGVNHQFIHNGYDIWDTAIDLPRATAVSRLRQTRVSVIRFPGGTQANLYQWAHAVGSERGCQVYAKPGRYGVEAPGGREYGPDEYMEIVSAVGAQPALMVQFISSSPRDAANWVEYMNTPVGAGNPNGGTDWADVRAANGHPAPYHVRLWEIGNEQRNRPERWWMSPDDTVALHQYIYGGHADIADEALGKDCRHPTAGILSDGTAGQVFEMLLPPALPATTKVSIDGTAWRRVDSWANAGPSDKVYVLSPLAGLVAFGDGVHGAIPPAGSVVKASYRSEHLGVFEYIQAMKAVDPSIVACTSWGSVAFIKAVKRPYGCFSIHSYTNFMRERTDHWVNSLEGHDRIMIGCRVQREYVQEMTSQLPPRTVVPMTEFGLLWGDTATWPDWMDSMSSALYMSSQWITWMRLGIPLATGNDLAVYNFRGLFSPSPDFDLSPTAIARIAIAPMFDVGGRNLVVHVTGNPIRNPGLGAGTYPGLSVASTHAPHGNLYLMVVNRLPFTGQSVNATVQLSGFTSAGTMFVRTVTSPSYRSTARTGDVALHTSQRAIAATRFSYRFPPHSITLLRIPSGHGA